MKPMAQNTSYGPDLFVCVCVCMYICTDRCTHNIPLAPILMFSLHVKRPLYIRVRIGI